VLGNAGLTGVLPKAVISMDFCFFPVTIRTVKELRSPDPLQLDWMCGVERIVRRAQGAPA
jgi:NitT/TauT family transport system permease protein